jgi:hypothetical protein
MRADGDVTLDELARTFGPWVRARLSRTSFHRGLVTSLTRRKAKIWSLVGQEREGTKHVESFGGFSWIRVQFSAPPPIIVIELTVTPPSPGRLSMRSSRCNWLLVLAILIGGSITTLGQNRIQLVQGRRAIKDKVSFIVEEAPQKNQNDLTASSMYLYSRFADRGVSGMVYVDGVAVTRFDESFGFNSNPVDIAYGRHTITFVFAGPTVITDVTVTVASGTVREILDFEAPVVSVPTGLEHRIVELERKLHELEAEIATLKGKRVQ